MADSVGRHVEELLAVTYGDNGEQLGRHEQLPPPVPHVRVRARHDDVPVVHARLARGDPQQCWVEQPQRRVRCEPGELEPAEDDARVAPPPRALVRLEQRERSAVIAKLVEEVA